jgi:hypothetical protein
MQDDIPVHDVIAQAVVAPANPPLALSRIHTRKLLDLMLPTLVVGIFPKGGD